VGLLGRVDRNSEPMSNGYSECLEIDAPPAAVWAVVSDVPQLARVLSGMTALAIEGPDPTLREGLTWTQTRVIAGRTGSERLTVTDVQPGGGYVAEGGSRGFDYRIGWELDPLGELSCRLCCTFEAQPRSAAGRLLLRLFGRLGAGATRTAMRTDLRDIARAAARTR
jgi:hypothetical protein